MEYKNTEKLISLYESNVSKPGLLRIIELTKRLGNPQNNVKCIHVAGTNGKGSTCAYIESILRTAGYRTALFTSPHISELREYIKFNNEIISEVDFDELLGKVFAVCEEMTGDGFAEPSYFEVMTAAAFKYFCDNDADIAIVETGMGGTLDATNIINPILSVITSISMDHVEQLGNAIKKIAEHKAGIIKQNTPLVLSPNQIKPVKKLIKTICRKMGSEFINTDIYKIELYEFGLEGQSFQIKNDKEIYRIKSKTTGMHQAENMVTSICTINKLKDLGFEIGYSEIKKGLSSVKVENRIEYFRDKNIIIDASHNPDSVKKLKEVLVNTYDYERIVLVCSVLKTKDAHSMIKEYKKFVDFVVTTQSKHALSMNAFDLRKIFEKEKIEAVSEDEIDAAIAIAKSKFEAKKTLIVISGSFYIISDAKKVIKELYSEN